MSQENIIRAWKDESFRNSLSEEERALLPEHPAGSLTDTELEKVAGGEPYTIAPGCDDHTGVWCTGRYKTITECC
jgi:mersacidin/lichenicidin family type 2 lantibiotic